MAEKIFKEQFCEIAKIKVCTTTADLNFDNYTEPGTYEIYEDMGNGKVRLYQMAVDRSTSGDCVTQTRMYCGKIEYRQADGAGEWNAWSGTGSAKVEQLARDVEELDISFGELYNKTSQMENDIDDVKKRAGQNETRIESLESDVSTINNDIHAINNDISTNSTAIEENTKRVEKIEDDLVLPEFVGSVDEMTDTSKRYVLSSTGTIWEYGETFVDDTDRELFNIDEIALNQNPDGSTRNGSFTTGFIPTNLKSVENFGFKTTIKGVKSIAGGSGNPQLYKVRHYDADFNAVTGDMYANNMLVSQVDADTVDIWLGTQDGETYHSALGKDKYNQIVYTKFLIGISSSAITVDRVPSNFSITTNEPKTITGGGWVDTGIAFETYVDLIEKTQLNASDIKNVSTRVTALENGEKVSPVPSYWTDAVSTAIDKVKELQDEGGNDVINFMWFSDVHYGGKKSYVGNIGTLCAKVMDDCDVPLALMCGDTLTAGANNLATEDAVLKMLEDAWDIYSPIGKERLMLLGGNHEDAYGKYTPETGEEVHYTNKADPKKIWNKLYRPQTTDFRRVFGGNGTYFWVDNVPQKVRFVCLNSSYYDGEAIPNGTVKAMSVGFGADQLAWLEHTALDVETDWSVAVCVHVPPIAAYASLFGDDYSEVRRIITDTTTDIIAVFAGHMHRDNVVSGDLPCPIVTITCAINTPYDGNAAERVAGTDKETALDVVSINKAARTINCIRIGAGSDREIGY